MGIKLINLVKNYGKQEVLQSINLEINSGSIVGLLGPNGAGKSTLMRSICGEIKADSGEIFIDGINLQKQEIQAKKRIGFLAEHNPLYLDDFVKEYLFFVGKIHKTPKEKIKEIIEQVGLEPEQHKKINQLSKGYKQRVGLAQALIGNPENLILDEPTNGLDPNQILEIRNLIKRLAKDKTIVLSTHILQEVEALCDRVILILKGKVISDLPINEFKGQYENLEQAFNSLTNTTT